LIVDYLTAVMGYAIMVKIRDFVLVIVETVAMVSVIDMRIRVIARVIAEHVEMDSAIAVKMI